MGVADETQTRNDLVLAMERLITGLIREKTVKENLSDFSWTKECAVSGTGSNYLTVILADLTKAKKGCQLTLKA